MPGEPPADFLIEIQLLITKCKLSSSVIQSQTRQLFRTGAVKSGVDILKRLKLGPRLIKHKHPIQNKSVNFYSMEIL